MYIVPSPLRPHNAITKKWANENEFKKSSNEAKSDAKPRHYFQNNFRKTAERSSV